MMHRPFINLTNDTNASFSKLDRLFTKIVLPDWTEKEDSVDVILVFLAFGVRMDNRVCAKKLAGFLESLDPGLGDFSKTIESQAWLTYSEINDLQLAKWNLAEDLIDAGVPLSARLQEFLFAEPGKLTCQIAEILQKSMIAECPPDLNAILNKETWLRSFVEIFFPTITKSAVKKFCEKIKSLMKRIGDSENRNGNLVDSMVKDKYTTTAKFPVGTKLTIGKGYLSRLASITQESQQKKRWKETTKKWKNLMKLIEQLQQETAKYKQAEECLEQQFAKLKATNEQLRQEIAGSDQVIQGSELRPIRISTIVDKTQDRIIEARRSITKNTRRSVTENS